MRCINCYKMNDYLEKKELIEPCNDQCSFCFLNYSDVLGKNSMFRNIEPKEIGDIIRNVHHQVRLYQKGELIAGTGEYFSNLLIIVKGSVVGEIADFEGKTLCIDELHPADTIASSYIFSEQNKLPINITAKEATKVLIIHKEDLLKLFRKNERVLLNYLQITANKALHLSNKLKILGLNTIKGKIAHYLLNLLQENNGLEFVLPKTQIELSELFGVTRPSIGRVFRELDTQGYIIARGKNIKITNKKGLSSLLK